MTRKKVRSRVTRNHLATLDYCISSTVELPSKQASLKRQTGAKLVSYLSLPSFLNSIRGDEMRCRRDARRRLRKRRQGEEEPDEGGGGGTRVYAPSERPAQKWRKRGQFVTSSFAPVAGRRLFVIEASAFEYGNCISKRIFARSLNAVNGRRKWSKKVCS